MEETFGGIILAIATEELYVGDDMHEYLFFNDHGHILHLILDALNSSILSLFNELDSGFTNFD